MWRMIILSLLLSLFCATDHLSFFCLMTLAHIVCWCRCNTDTQMTLSDNHTFWEGPCTGKKRKHLPEIHISHHTQKHFLTFSGTPPWGFNRFSSHRVLYSLPGGGGVLKVFITNLPSTCWLLRISGQFCDGSFSKSVINTKTAHTRLSIQNNLFLSSAQIVSRIFIIQLHQFPFIKMDLSLIAWQRPKAQF